MRHDLSALPIPADSGFWERLLLDWHYGPAFHGVLLWLLVSLVAALPLLIAGVLVGKRRRRRGEHTGGNSEDW